MVPSFIGRLRDHGAVHKINEYVREPWYVLIIALLTAISAVWGLELPVYTAFIVVGIFLCLLGDDLLALMPIVICCYIAPSVTNNPGRNENSIFYLHHGGLYLIILAALFAVALIWRLVTDADFGGRKFWTRKRSLTLGMVLLGFSYLLGGLGMERYAQFVGKQLAFSALQFAAVLVMYFLFSGAVKWEKAPKDYFAWIGLAVGLAVLVQLADNYLSGRIFMEGGQTIDRELIATGWGMHNNIGGLLAMVLPFPFYLAYTRKRSWIYTLLATVLLIGTMISCSRTSMVIAAVEYGICSVLLLRRKETRKENLYVYFGVLVAVTVVTIVVWERLLNIFALFLEEIDLVSKRDLLFINGMKQFMEYPLFGGTFYPQGEYVPWDWAELEAFSSFFPPRWHNTLVQIGASCGIVGLCAYGFHRFQTVRMLLRHRSTENLYIGMYLAALLIAGLMDNHFFNIGPVLLYSMALAFAENIEQSTV